MPKGGVLLHCQTCNDMTAHSTVGKQSNELGWKYQAMECKICGTRVSAGIDDFQGNLDTPEDPASFD
jgi:hypothetical protein